MIFRTVPKLHLQQKGLYVARTVVDVREDKVVNLHVFSVSNEVFHLAGETVISLPKPVIDVTSLELNEENQGSAMDPARVINEHVSQGAVDRTLLEALQEILERNTYYLNGSETERLSELLFNYEHVFSISDGDLGTTHMVQHRIETGNALPI